MFDKNKDKEKEEAGNNPFCELNECGCGQDVAEEIIEEATADEAELQKELDDLNSKHLRLMADFDNYRKRQAQERESLLKYGAGDTLCKIIPVLDTVERAKASIEGVEDPKIIKESYEIIFKQLFEMLEKCGLEKIDTEIPFDPNLHEAVLKTPTDEHPEYTILNVAQTGYKMGDNILRPALVNVAVAKEDEA